VRSGIDRRIDFAVTISCGEHAYTFGIFKIVFEFHDGLLRQSLIAKKMMGCFMNFSKSINHAMNI
jgi:hypothetical protein